jgi:hypothetical protein
VIPAREFSAIAVKLQSYIPPLSNQAAQNNFNASNGTGLTNCSTTDRIDYAITSKNTLTVTAAIGRQASSNPVGQTTLQKSNKRRMIGPGEIETYAHQERAKCDC